MRNISSSIAIYDSWLGKILVSSSRRTRRDLSNKSASRPVMSRQSLAFNTSFGEAKSHNVSSKKASILEDWKKVEFRQ